MTLDDRTKQYLRAIANRLGLVEIRSGYKVEDFEPEFDCRLPAATADVGHLPDGNWIAQYTVQTDIDDYTVVRFYYTCKPSRQAVATTYLLNRAQWLVLSRTTEGKYRCWECGHTVHWLDAPGDLGAKLVALEERCCCS